MAFVASGLIPVLVLFSIFAVAPVGIVLWLSLHRYNQLAPVAPFIGLRNFEYAFTNDALFINALTVTLKYALVAGVVELPQCGIGGYGGHAIISLPDGQVTSIDFNSTAPAAATAEMFFAADGKVNTAVHNHGWLAAGNLSFEKLNARVYDEIFATPASDPWLGLVPPNAYSAIEEDGIVKR